MFYCQLPILVTVKIHFESIQVIAAYYMPESKIKIILASQNQNTD